MLINLRFTFRSGISEARLPTLRRPSQSPTDERQKLEIPKMSRDSSKERLSNNDKSQDRLVFLNELFKVISSFLQTL